ncbi:hypothetical protein [Hafnia alvei]|uniref:Uncharacterized protein n=1 Tax=Hafnia alvei TaxID=569 RepID=A0A1C6YVW4_HAFAL|nr:hypothetical protein [Hafnia alvei]NLS56229.1 hypothetical protein [Hafnia alvei]SCM50984.1 hypothetical protein BN1044_00434 [Hafnia alvei]
MLSKYDWLNEDLVCAFSDLLKMGEMAVNADIFLGKLLEIEGVDNILRKIQTKIQIRHPNEADGILLWYFADFLGVYNGLFFEANFKTKKEREKSKLKIIKACDSIIENMQALDTDKFVGSVKSEHLSVVNCVGLQGKDEDLLVILKIRDVLESIKDISEMDLPKSLTKVSVRDAKFNYFCRELLLINNRWFKSPYWESISIFAYSFIDGAPESKDRITSVRNACGLTSLSK